MFEEIAFLTTGDRTKGPLRVTSNRIECCGRRGNRGLTDRGAPCIEETEFLKQLLSDVPNCPLDNRISPAEVPEPIIWKGVFPEDWWSDVQTALKHW